eukprot:734344-Amphidinium_carterae.6
MVRRLKPQAGIGTAPKPKSRFCVLGHQDPDTALLRVYAPTPAVEVMMAYFQATASLGFALTVLDVKQAFVEGLPLQRERGPILVQPCPGLPVPSSSIIELKVALYGLDDAPYQWRQTLIAEMTNLGFGKSLVDACVWLLRNKQGEPQVMALLDVDDIVLSGKPKNMEPVLRRLRERFKIGKEEAGCSEFCGRRLEQKEDGSIVIDMQKYIAEKLHEVPLEQAESKGRKAQSDRPLTQGEFESLRSLVYKLAWLGRETRPEMAGAASMMASRLNQATVTDLMEGNVLVRYLKKTADRRIIIHPIPVHRMHWLAFSDAGATQSKETGQLDSQGQVVEATQGAWILFSCQDKPEPGSCHKVSPIMWKSTKLRRKVPSTFAGETLALSDAVGALEWLQALWQDIVMNGVSRSDWRSTLSHYTVPLKEGGHFAQRTGQCLVTDAKALFDALQKEASGSKQDRRAAVDLSIIQESMQRTKSEVRWVPHGRMLADPLTKIRVYTASPALDEAIATGRYRFITQETELRERAADTARKTRSRTSILKNLLGEQEIESRKPQGGGAV